MPHLVHVDLEDLHDHVACPRLQTAHYRPTAAYRTNRVNPEHAGALTTAGGRTEEAARFNLRVRRHARPDQERPDSATLAWRWSVTAPEAVARPRVYLRRLLSQRSTGPRLVRRAQLTLSMRTTGTYDDGPTSAASQRCLQLCTRAVAHQGSRLPGATGPSVVIASARRSVRSCRRGIVTIMSLPVSKSALDRLGVRLISSDPITESDLQELAFVAHAYQTALDQTKLHLGQLGYSATTRVKTTGTLIEKLQRESTRLSQVQDLAGARIVVANRAEQNDAVNQIRKAFDGLGGGCKVIDRRENPSYGYRAVHLIVRLEGTPIEIQVRTDLQDMWAQITEKLADRWGRGIRYGEDPENPDAELRAIRLTVRTRRQTIEALGRLSYAAALAEEGQLHVIRLQQQLDEVIQMLGNVELSGASGSLLDEELPPEIAQPAIDGLRKILDNFPRGRALNLSPSMTVSDLLELTRSMATVEEVIVSRRVRDALQLIAQLIDG